METKQTASSLCMVSLDLTSAPTYALPAGMVVRHYMLGDASARNEHAEICERRMSPKSPIKKPVTDVDVGATLAKVVQVVLHNDDHTAMEYVVLCLMKVFAHPITLATKIMMEAHRRGRAIAEVEAEPQAIAHRDQLQALGLMATIEQL